MGKNRNRNRRNKKKNGSTVENKTLDLQVNVSSPDTHCSHLNAGEMKEVTVSVKCKVADQEKCKTLGLTHSFAIPNVNERNISNNTTKNCKDALAAKAQVLKPTNDNGCTSKHYIPIGNNYVKKQESISENKYYENARMNLKMLENLRIDNTKAAPNSKKTNDIIKKASPQIKNNHADRAKTDFKSTSSNFENEISLISSATANGVKPKANTHQIKHATVNNFSYSQNKDVDTFKQSLQRRVKKSESDWERFERLYRTWKIERQNTIEKLEKLVAEVHKDQMMFNQGNVALKEWNVGSREIKNQPVSPALDFFASLAAFVTDAASSVTSAVQAINVDKYAEMFKEIMEHDAEITKPLYAARSQSLVEYRNVEEMIRQYHSDTLGSAIDNISSTLRVEDLWMDIKSAKGDNTVGQIIDSVGLFLQRNANSDTMGEVCNSIQGYLDDNPAALEACKSAGRALYGAYDTWGRDQKKGITGIANNMSVVSNRYFLMEERKELDRLRLIANDDEENQAKLESDIHSAISSLRGEMTEITHIFEERNQMSDNRWYF